MFGNSKDFVVNESATCPKEAFKTILKKAVIECPRSNVSKAMLISKIAIHSFIMKWNAA